MPRRKERLAIKSSADELEPSETQARRRRDPQELKIYIKQLSRALKFLPLGSRPYYAVTGELLRANTELRALLPPSSNLKGQHQPR